MKRILIADHDRNVTFTLKKVLQAESYEVKDCNDCEFLLQLAGSQNFDLIIINSRLETADGRDPMPSLRKTQPSAAFIVIHDMDVSEQQQIPRVFDQIRKPIDFQYTISRIQELFNGGGFSGILSDIYLADYIQMLCMNGITKAILVRKNKEQGIILVQAGKVVYADTAEFKGEEAFHNILSWKEGQIKEVKVKKFPTPNIDKDIQQLLLGATLYIDEEDTTAVAEEMDNELFGTEIVAALHDDTEHANTLAEKEKQEGKQPKDMPPEGFLRKHFNKSGAILAILLIGMFFAFHNIIKDEVKAGKSPLLAAAESTVQDAPPGGVAPPGKPVNGVSMAGLDKSPENALAATTKETSQSNKSIGTLQSAPQENSLGPEEVILRLHGSNTIGASLAPALVAAYLHDKLHATDIVILPEKKENEQAIKAKLNGLPIAVEIQAHGSATAFQDLKAGTCDIGNASRKIKDKEAEELSILGDMTSISNEHVIGLDGIAVLVNKTNTIKQISTNALQAMFSGGISDWQGVNGQSGTINIYSRDDKSGTYDTFKSIILGEEHTLISIAKRYESNADLSDDVSRDSLSIGFTGLPYIRNSKALAVSEEGARPIYPNFFTVATEDYPISRRLFMYTASIPKNPHVAPFINFVLSEEGQKVVQKVGFIDMNIRTFNMDPAEDASTLSMPKLRDYLNAVKGAQRLSLNFRFHKGQTALDNRSIHDLDRIISFLADKLDKKIILAGFADNSGDYEFNHRLAMSRASLVTSELKARGIAVSETFSCGQEMPVASNVTPQGREKNRRVEVWLK